MVEIYTSLVISVMEYASELWHSGLTKLHPNTIEAIQNSSQDYFLDEIYTTALSLTDLTALAFYREVAGKRLFQDITDKKHCLHHLLPPKNRSFLSQSAKLID